MICIDAPTEEDAVEKLIEAGAMACRNREAHCRCCEIHLEAPPVSDQQLREVVRLYMKEEDQVKKFSL